MSASCMLQTVFHSKPKNKSNLSICIVEATKPALLQTDETQMKFTIILFILMDFLTHIDTISVG